MKTCKQCGSELWDNGRPRVDPATQVAIVWSIEDVQDIRRDLNDKQALDVLEQVEHHHDAECGVTWDTLRFWANELYPNPDYEEDYDDE